MYGAACQVKKHVNRNFSMLCAGICRLAVNKTRLIFVD